MTTVPNKLVVDVDEDGKLHSCMVLVSEAKMDELGLFKLGVRVSPR